MSPSSQQPAFLAIGPQKLVTILDIFNAAPAPSEFCVGSGLSQSRCLRRNRSCSGKYLNI